MIYQTITQAELARIDAWIDDVLLANSSRSNPNNNNDDGDNATGTASVELLYTPQQVADRLMQRRMSEEHVLDMFRRLSDTGHAASRSRCSPLIALLVKAAGKMDCMDRDQQPNKRWSGKVERKLQHRLFARDWNIDLEEHILEPQGRDRNE